MLKDLVEWEQLLQEGPVEWEQLLQEEVVEWELQRGHGNISAPKSANMFDGYYILDFCA